MAQIALGNNDAAKNHYLLAMQLNPNDAWTQWNLGILEADLWPLGGSIAVFEPTFCSFFHTVKQL